MGFTSFQRPQAFIVMDIAGTVPLFIIVISACCVLSLYVIDLDCHILVTKNGMLYGGV
jgi:hypothetical protein